MGAATGTILTVGATIFASNKLRKAQKSAARDLKSAQREEAQRIEGLSNLAQQDILSAQTQAAQQIGGSSQAALQPIQPFARGALSTAQRAESRILSGQQGSGALGQSVQQSARDASRNIGALPGVNLSSPVRKELNRQARITSQGVAPLLNQSLLNASNQGILATADIAGIRGRGLQNLANIASATGSQRGSALVGAIPNLVDFGLQADQSRLLQDLATQQFQTGTAESLANLVGQLTQLKGSS